MGPTVVFHVVAGALALTSGYVALFSPKGATVHRRAGTVFVYTMLAMSLTGATIAALQNGDGSVIAGVLTAYLVVTGLITVKRPARWSRRDDVGMMVLAFAVASISLTLGIHTMLSATGRRDGLPPFPYLMFGTVGLIAAVGDVRMLRAATLVGGRRLARHLWRMCWALWVAASSFFFGQADELPKALRIMPLLAVPVVVVLVAMLYWLWKVRGRRQFRGVVRGPVSGASPVAAP